jgi:hypothetical protein
MIERLFERLLTSWLFWGMIVVFALWFAIVEAFFPRHVPEFKPDSSAAVAGSAAGSRPREQK